jgi:hypothetical protein
LRHLAFPPLSDTAVELGKDFGVLDARKQNTGALGPNAAVGFLQENALKELRRTHVIDYNCNGFAILSAGACDDISEPWQDVCIDGKGSRNRNEY